MRPRVWTCDELPHCVFRLHDDSAVERPWDLAGCDAGFERGHGLAILRIPAGLVITLRRRGQVLLASVHESRCDTKGRKAKLVIEILSCS